jgi:glyceraldehyde-3-phosphate dehydrogenase/erythrose-4-phosphate dehydrogenase
MARIAINGLGRIGKLVARSLLNLKDDSIELVLVNEPVGRIEQHALWLEFDTVHGNGQPISRQMRTAFAFLGAIFVARKSLTKLKLA